MKMNAFFVSGCRYCVIRKDGFEIKGMRVTRAIESVVGEAYDRSVNRMGPCAIRLAV